LEENTFEPESSLPSYESRTYGIYSGNNPSNINLYKNSFNTIQYGIYSTTCLNLQSECNEFSGTYRGHYIGTNGAFTIQGSPTHAAGNKFLTSRDGIYTTQSKTYYYDPSLPNQTPPAATNLTRIAVEQLYQNTNQCLSHFGGSGGGTQLASIQTQIDTKETELATLTDGGSTQTLLDAIEQNDRGQAMKLRNLLLTHSPNLSDTVMTAIVAKEDDFPAVMLTQVLEKNPQAAKSDAVRRALQNRRNHLPDHLLARIDAGKTAFSRVEELRTELVRLKTEKNQVFNAHLNALITDSTADRTQEIVSLLNTEIGTDAEYRKIGYQLHKRNYASARALFDAMPQRYSLSPKEQTEYSEMQTIMDVQAYTTETAVNYFAADSSQRAELHRLALHGGTRAKAHARAILSIIERAEFPLDEPDPIELPETGTNKSFKPQVAYQSVSPNPATDYTVLSFRLAQDESPESVRFVLYNAQGEALQSQNAQAAENDLLYECTGYAPGVYVLRKYNGTKHIGTEKVFIGVPKTDDSITKSELRLYPNPVSHKLYVENLPANTLVRIYDMSGKEVYTLQTGTGEALQIDVSAFTAGMYMLKVGTESRTFEVR